MKVKRKLIIGIVIVSIILECFAASKNEPKTTLFEAVVEDWTQRIEYMVDNVRTRLMEFSEDNKGASVQVKSFENA